MGDLQKTLKNYNSGWHHKKREENIISGWIPIKPMSKPRSNNQATWSKRDYSSYLQTITRKLTAKFNRGEPSKGKVSLTLIFYFKEKRRGTLSNYLKGFEESLEGNIIEDNKQITDIQTSAIEETGKSEGIDYRIEFSFK